MGHHGPLLPMYFGKRIWTTVPLKHVANYLYRIFIISIKKAIAATSKSTISYIPTRENKYTNVWTNSFISVVSILKTSAS